MIKKSIAPLPHQPVLYHEILKYLQPKPGGKYIDGTLGAGGHAYGILETSSPDGQLLGLDLDPQAIQISQKQLKIFGNRCIIRQTSYARIIEQVNTLEWECVNGVILDLGISSMQLLDGERGFSFLKKAQLDMRFDPNQERSASDLVNSLSETQLAEMIWRFSQEPRAGKIAKLIVENRPITTTIQLADLVTSAYRGKRGKTHPATRTFQAFRIAVNNELEVLEKGISNSLQVLCAGGRLAVIAFHSLEHQIVKRILRNESKDCVCPPEQPLCDCGHKAAVKVITKKAVKPSQEELINNPRSRSARLRVAEKI